MIENNSAPKIADHQPSTSNPGKNAAAILMTAPLITKVNKPKVNKLIGKVKKISIGQIKVLTSPINSAAKNAAQKPEILKPEIIFEVNKTAHAETAQ
jgi:hypothetical protein